MVEIDIEESDHFSTPGSVIYQASRIQKLSMITAHSERLTLMSVNVKIRERDVFVGSISDRAKHAPAVSPYYLTPEPFSIRDRA